MAGYILEAGQSLVVATSHGTVSLKLLRVTVADKVNFEVELGGRRQQISRGVEDLDLVVRAPDGDLAVRVLEVYRRGVKRKAEVSLRAPPAWTFKFFAAPDRPITLHEAERAKVERIAASPFKSADDRQTRGTITQ